MTTVLVAIDIVESTRTALESIKEISPTAVIACKVAHYLSTRYRITIEVIQIHWLYEKIIKSPKKNHADFVFIPVRQHGPLKRMFYTSTDWNLIQMYLGSLLLARDQGPIKNKPVIASGNICDEDAAHQELNRIVLARATALAEVSEAEVHLLYVYGPAVVTHGAQTRRRIRSRKTNTTPTMQK